MSLAIFNGSPRGSKSNSSVITSWFLNGYNKENKTFFLNKVKQYDHYLTEAAAFDEYLFVMPLYVDGMPGQVKYFFEKMYGYKELFKGKKVTYIIHSGFGEGVQNRQLEAYLNRFSQLMNFSNCGVIIAPGSEGFRLMPPKMTQKKNDLVATFGKCFVNNETYDPILLKKLVKKETSSNFSIFMFKIFSKIGLTNIYWNSELKKNNAYDKRFDAPYSESPFK